MWMGIAVLRRGKEDPFSTGVISLPRRSKETANEGVGPTNRAEMTSGIEVFIRDAR